MKINQAHRAFLNELLHLLKEAGVSPEQLVAELARRGIAASPNSLTDISGVNALVLLETAVDLSGDPCLMIRVGQQLGIASFGSFGFALMSCANVRESVRLMLRYGQVLIQPSWAVHEDEGGLLLRPRISMGTAAQQQLFTELVFSNLAAAGKSLYGSATAISFPPPSPARGCASPSRWNFACGPTCRRVTPTSRWNL